MHTRLTDLYVLYQYHRCINMGINARGETLETTAATSS